MEDLTNAISVEVPIRMGEAIAGRIEIQLASGEFKGTLKPEFAEILAQGLGEGLMEISFYGRPVNMERAMEMQEKLRDLTKIRDL